MAFKMLDLISSDILREKQILLAQYQVPASSM